MFFCYRCAVSEKTESVIALLQLLLSTNCERCLLSLDFRRQSLLITDLETLLVRNGRKHFTSAPYYPSSNELTERAVQLVKRGLKKTTSGSMKSAEQVEKKQSQQKKQHDLRSRERLLEVGTDVFETTIMVLIGYLV